MLGELRGVRPGDEIHYRLRAGVAPGLAAALELRVVRHVRIALVDFDGRAWWVGQFLELLREDLYGFTRWGGVAEGENGLVIDAEQQLLFELRAA
jgi:hypothetical protein